MSSILKSQLCYTDLQAVLKQFWGYEDFRAFQKPIVQSVLDMKDTLAILPTGGGKSICYQAPAMLLDGITVVVSPLIALMNDQVEVLNSKGIEAMAFHSGKTTEEKTMGLERLRAGKYKLIYVSPEKLVSKKFIDNIRSLKVSLLAVDEAHCISQWGHEFRPSYREIASFRSAFRQMPILALTATATPKVQKDIVDNLKLEKPDCWVNSTTRNELIYEVIKTDNKFGQLMKSIRSTNKGSIIVYARNRRTIAELSHQLGLRGISALGYHAGMSGIQKLENQMKWISNEAQVMVATNAFGMGIDKPDVRKVIHYEPPLSLEEYVQEAGRAGRDRSASTAVILLGGYDMRKKEEDLRKTYPPIEQILKVFNHLEEATINNYSPNFSIQQFAEAINTSILKTYYSLKVLDRWGIIVMGNQLKEPSLVKIIQGIESSSNRVSNDAQLLLRLLVKMYDGILYKKVKINENYIAAEIKCTTPTLLCRLLELKNNGLIEFIPSSGSTDLRVLINKAKKVERILLKSNYLALKKVALDKLESMNEYAHSTACRQKTIESYFGGKGLLNNCGNCDNCTSEIPKEGLIKEEKEMYKLLGDKWNKVDELLSHKMTMKRIQLINCIEEWERQGLIEVKGNLLKRK